MIDIEVLKHEIQMWRELKGRVKEVDIRLSPQKEKAGEQDEADE